MTASADAPQMQSRLKGVEPSTVPAPTVDRVTKIEIADEIVLFSRRELYNSRYNTMFDCANFRNVEIKAVLR